MPWCQSNSWDTLTKALNIEENIWQNIGQPTAMLSFKTSSFQTPSHPTYLTKSSRFARVSSSAPQSCDDAVPPFCLALAADICLGAADMVIPPGWLPPSSSNLCDSLIVSSSIALFSSLMTEASLLMDEHERNSNVT